MAGRPKAGGRGVDDFGMSDIICNQMRDLHARISATAAPGVAGAGAASCMTNLQPVLLPVLIDAAIDPLLRAVAAYLARYRGQTRMHTESDLRAFLVWCAERGSNR